MHDNVRFKKTNIEPQRRHRVKEERAKVDT